MGAMKQIATKLQSGKRLSPDERKFYHVFCVKPKPPKATNQLNLFTADICGLKYTYTGNINTLVKAPGIEPLFNPVYLRKVRCKKISAITAMSLKLGQLKSLNLAPKKSTSK